MFFKMTVSRAIESLKEVASFESATQASQAEMLNIIEKVEKQHPDSNSAQLEYWLGVAWRNYTAWFVRGDDREEYLLKAADHLQRAYDIEISGSGLNWAIYAGALGSLLVNEAIVRDLERAIPLLEKLFKSTQSYDPLLCSYADALYKAKEFEAAAEVASALHQRAESSEEWEDFVPPAPMRIAAKAYRAQVRQFKKKGQLKEAVEVSEKLLKTGAATENDERIYQRLIQS